MFTIDDIPIELAEENKGIRLTTDDDNLILPNQTMTSVEHIVRENFRMVKAHYQAKSGVSVSIDGRDLSLVSLRIVLHYLYMYNKWREMYEHHKDRDLKFLIEDFEHPSTHDLIIWYFRNKYLEKYSTQCELMLGMSADEFRSYEKSRQEFHDMW
jgi:hypothetical protein